MKEKNEKADNGPHSIIPPEPHVVIYFSEKGCPEEDASAFLAAFEKKCNNPEVMPNPSRWKMAAWHWIWRSRSGKKKSIRTKKAP